MLQNVFVLHTPPTGFDADSFNYAINVLVSFLPQ